MPILQDTWIRERALQGMIEPFVEHQEKSGVISYGLSSFMAMMYVFLTNSKFLQTSITTLSILKTFPLQGLLIEKPTFVLFHPTALF